MTPKELVALALEARTHAYVPYSHFAVGSALLTAGGRIYQGCNIENAGYTPTICAERTAFFKAVYDGVRDFSAIAVVGGPEDGPAAALCAPCGVCRQVMREFCGEDFPVYLGRADGGYLETTLGKLLPYGFTKSDLGK